MSGHSIPLYIFDEPLHAAFVIGFGTVFGTFATSIVYTAKNHKSVSSRLRFDPVFFLIKRRQRTDEELEAALPAFFWPLYGGVGRLFQLVGFLIVLLGLIGLVTSLAKKLM